MATHIFDRHGRLAPVINVTDLRRRSGRLYKLVNRRGAVRINVNGETLAVALSLDQFALLLLGFRPKPRRKKRKTLRKIPKKHLAPAHRKRR